MSMLDGATAVIIWLFMIYVLYFSYFWYFSVPLGLFFVFITVKTAKTVKIKILCTGLSLFFLIAPITALLKYREIFYLE
ncbi:hypothetical protein [Photorhabdus caribbeanensis]|uniref:hypothetical protein n=1 Tax=Photorhabdus caribbeanensis TaxID=1004165 RepID=UPI001BD63B61|nr:hypothetical protein [Photorhabdus caribbeanensis]MBS9422995.1 hypothetical protein [Photorhabdus caribbeanensis]